MTAERTTGFTDINQQHWSLRYLPPWARPYGRLARWDRPIGIWLLMFPCWWSAALGAAPEWGRLIGWMALFALGALAMRGAGCTWNDIVDRKVDAQVERTRSRPLPAGEVTLRNALIWMVLQSAVGAAILFKLNKFAGGVALLSLVLVAVYPTMKRFTYWPQVVLGLAFNWGALVGYAAVTGTLSWAAVALYVGGVAWTLIYDTIYAMQDQRDDAIIGVRSTARRFAAAPRRWLSLFAVLALLAWALAGYLANLGPYYFGFLLVIALHFGWQIALAEATRPGRLPRQVQGQCLGRRAADGRRHRRPRRLTMARLPADPEGFIRANTALEAPAMVPEFKLWLASEYVPIWQATEAWLEEQNIDPPYWAFCWPGGQAIARYLLDNPEQVRGKRVIDFAAGSGVSSMAAARAGAASVLANDIDALSLVAAQLNAKANGLSFDDQRRGLAGRTRWRPCRRRGDRGRRLLRARHVGACPGLAARPRAAGPPGAAGRSGAQLFQRPGPFGARPL